MFKTALGLLCLIPIGHAASVADAAQRAIALLQSSQKSWFTKQECGSCHNQWLPALAFRDAREHGIPFDEAAARADAVHALKPLADIDRAVQYTHQIDAAMDDGMRLVAAHAAGVRASFTTAIYARHIAMRQRPDGHWDTGDNRPPQSYNPITATAIALRALELYHHPSLDADTHRRVARARTWMERQAPLAIEERAHQLLGLAWANAGETERKRLADSLAAQQRDDGGWNQITGRASDAYSTGEALVALHDAGGMRTSDRRWQRGIQFLLDTQQPDGSWHVASRLMPPVRVSPPYFDTGYPYGHDQFISMMGASWAIRALARAAGPAKAIEPPALVEAAPRVQSWMETVLFGSADDVSWLLTSEWKPNSATAAGTTALMMAMPDVAKARLLIDRGADVNARSKTRYSAMLVAAQYPNSLPALELLLERSAQNRLPKEAGAPRFNATGLGAAVISGFPELIPMFLKQGDRVDENFVFLGIFSALPALSAATSGDEPTLRALLDAKLPVDTVDDDGLTLLDWAVIADRVPVARLLIERGADVNRVDRFGMTPLQHAASIDFGQAEMIGLLRSSGAKLDARTKDGLTALDLARKHGHTNLLAGLGAM